MFGLLLGKRDGPQIVALEAGMGVGKSYAIDIADKVLFRKIDPIVLKVAYNRQQDLSAERASEGAASTVNSVAVDSSMRHPPLPSTPS
jgi:hypothetical protein